MKKVIALIISVCMLMAVMCQVTVLADDNVRVIVKDEEKHFDQMPVIINGRTLVPMRGIFEALGAAIYWDDATKTVTAKKSGKTITLVIGENSAVVDGVIMPLDVAPEIINGRTMVPVRFVSESLGEEVGWDGDNRTVTVGKGKLHMAEIINPNHRPVPTEFTKSNRLDDLIYYEAATQEEFEAAIPDKYTELISPDDLLDISQIKVNDESIKVKSEIVGVDGSDFDKAVRVQVDGTPAKDTAVMLRFNKKIAGMEQNDACLITFRLRCVSPAPDTGNAQIKVQVEHPKTYAKALFSSFNTSENNWTKIYMTFSGTQGCEDVAIRLGYGPQTVEIGDFSIKNFGQGVTLPSSPDQGLGNNPELEAGAEWRKEAFEKIEKIRKGDFSVIVKDKDGNVVPGAEVEWDMFDHEFQFGCTYGGNRDLFHKEFNGAVREADMKWGYYYPEQALEAFDTAYNNGVRYFRGHSIIFEKLVSAKGSNLIPVECGTAVENKDKAMLDKLIKDHINDIMPRFDKYTTDWDVENEMIANSLFRDAFGEEYVKEIYQWAREADPDGILYYNEAIMFDKRFNEKLEQLSSMGVDIDAIGLQSHMDDPDRTFKEMTEVYDFIASKGYRIKVTEYSAGNYEDEYLRASYTRDFLINAFSHEAMDGFYIWGFQDGKTYAKYSLFLDKDGNRKPTLDQWEDLIYNKWWTKDMKATTGADGKATIRGFYGDYDVTVNVKGNSKTVMAAYHEGYNNTLEIVIE